MVRRKERKKTERHVFENYRVDHWLAMLFIYPSNNIWNLFCMDIWIAIDEAFYVQGKLRRWKKTVIPSDYLRPNEFFIFGHYFSHPMKFSCTLFEF